MDRRKRSFQRFAGQDFGVSLKRDNRKTSVMTLKLLDFAVFMNDISSVTMNRSAYDGVDLRRLLIVGATIGINIGAVALLTFAPWSDWKAGLALNLVDNLLLLGS
jgi:hypothetical protein